MQVGQVMTRGVVIAKPDESLRVAAERMLETGVGMLPVCEHERLVGVVTDRDLAVRAVAKGSDPRRVTVRETMTPQLFYCFDDEPIAEAGRKMEERAVRRLVVLSRDKRLVGVISLDDLATLPGVGAVLEHVTEPRPEATH